MSSNLNQRRLAARKAQQALIAAEVAAAVAVAEKKAKAAAKTVVKRTTGLTAPRVVYKRVLVGDTRNGLRAIATLVLLPGTRVWRNIDKRANEGNRKNRASAALVVSIREGIKGDGKEVDIAFSMHDRGFVYMAGRMVHPDHFVAGGNDECAGGIHFFRDLADAQGY